MEPFAPLCPPPSPSAGLLVPLAVEGKPSALEHELQSKLALAGTRQELVGSSSLRAPKLSGTLSNWKVRFLTLQTLTKC
jgi:hypothetical protein